MGRSEGPADLSILLDVIDSMPADMLSECRDERPPQERHGLECCPRLPSRRWSRCLIGIVRHDDRTKSRQGRFRLPRHDGQQGAGRRVRHGAALLPVAHRRQRNVQRLRELTLCQAQANPHVPRTRHDPRGSQLDIRIEAVLLLIGPDMLLRRRIQFGFVHLGAMQERLAQTEFRHRVRSFLFEG
ncbi:hypothetical protein VP06_11610 [Methylobacterium aquaticum]|uniref:Uncharacterized protein n=1 Tax=Methylobacterium aquaticum TaxID=270351 RepID=A0A0J6V9N1_9HYPH|nr:hypothetical protein VP06_11610 [Methylobacterium aquaticum]